MATQATHFGQGREAACGRHKSRGRDGRTGCGNLYATTVASLVDCEKCRRTKAWKVADAAERDADAASKAERERGLPPVPAKGAIVRVWRATGEVIRVDASGNATIRWIDGKDAGRVFATTTGHLRRAIADQTRRDSQ